MLTKFGLQRLRQEEQTEPSAVLAFVNALTLPPQTIQLKRVAEPLSVTIEKAKKDINTAVIMAERNYGLHSSITVLILESVLANVRAGNATVAAMEFEQYKGELLKNE